MVTKLAMEYFTSLHVVEVAFERCEKMDEWLRLFVKINVGADSVSVQ